jgi:hypothetical protein
MMEGIYFKQLLAGRGGAGREPAGGSAQDRRRWTAAQARASCHTARAQCCRACSWGSLNLILRSAQ